LVGSGILNNQLGFAVDREHQRMSTAAHPLQDLVVFRLNSLSEWMSLLMSSIKPFAPNLH